MANSPQISVIIPSSHSHSDLLKIVSAVCSQTFKPYEVIIIDSFISGAICPDYIADLCKIYKVRLIYANRNLTFPGQARNIGLSLAKTEYVAFVDVQTIPRPYWLESSLDLLSKKDVDGIFGNTCFVAETWFEKLIRDAFFGVLPRKTLPGSIFKRRVFERAGNFIDWVRAGEDTDWMLRLELMKIPIVCMSIVTVDYLGLIGINLNSIQRKWYRNYSASSNLPHLFPQKLFLWMALYPLIIFIGFNWNYLIANWSIDSPFYIGHITKIAAVFPILAYIFLRGILLPFKRGVRLVEIFPIRFIAISYVSFMADISKALVFTIPNQKI
jgi:glycosyltransferase involved in cell wall biosynthesis